MIGDVIKVETGIGPDDQMLGLIVAENPQPDESSKEEYPKKGKWKVLCKGQLMDVHEISVSGEMKFYDVKRYTIHRLQQWFNEIEKTPPKKRLMTKHRRRSLRYGDYI